MTSCETRSSVFVMHKWRPRVPLSRWILVTSAMLGSSMPWAKAKGQEAVAAVAAAAVDKADAAVVPVRPMYPAETATTAANQITSLPTVLRRQGTLLSSKVVASSMVVPVVVVAASLRQRPKARQSRRPSKETAIDAADQVT